MLSQKHNTFNWPEEETPSTPHPEQTVPASSSWQGWSLWLRILGVVVALVGHLALAVMATQDYQSLGALLVILVGVVSAGLIRSWWSLLIVPVLFGVGFSLSSLFTHGFYGFGEFFSNLLSVMVLVLIVLVEIGVLIGTPLGKWIEQRLRH